MTRPLSSRCATRVSGALGSVQRQRQRSAVAEEVAPPRLGVGQVRGDVDLVAAAAVGHRNAERPSRTSPRVGDQRDAAPQSRPEAGRGRDRRDRRVQERSRAHDQAPMFVTLTIFVDPFDSDQQRHAQCRDRQTLQDGPERDDLVPITLQRAGIHRRRRTDRPRR